MAGISDSPGWKALFDAKPALRRSAYNVILCLSTDGVNPFRSGQHSCWPIVFKVLNLPPELASRTDLLILAGVVHGPRKPKSFQAYNLLLVDEMLDLRAGVDATSPEGEPVADIFWGTGVPFLRPARQWPDVRAADFGRALGLHQVLPRAANTTPPAVIRTGAQ